MQAMDVLLAFPSLILGLILVAMLGPVDDQHHHRHRADLDPAVRAHRARADDRASRSASSSRPAARSAIPTPRIVVVHILPNILAEILVMGSLWLANAIRTEASLAFIGLGVKPPTPTWGGMIREGFENILDSSWLALVPGVAILIVIFALNLLGDGLRDAIDPKLKGEAMTRWPTPVLAVADLTRVPRRRRSGARSSTTSRFDIGQRETLAIVGESGSGKSVTALSIMRLAAGRERPRRRARSLLDGRDLLDAARRARCARCAATEIAMIFQEPMTSLNPVLTRRLPDRRGAASTTAASTARRREAETLRILERVRIPVGARALARLSAPVLRRHAPARDDRDGARLPAEAADRRRADDRARRHDPGRRSSS